MSFKIVSQMLSPYRYLQYLPHSYLSTNPHTRDENIIIIDRWDEELRNKIDIAAAECDRGEGIDGKTLC